MRASSDPKQVLVVEDDPASRGQLVQMLQQDGFRVWEAPTGEEALELTATIQPDVILLDLGLPTLSGLDVLRT